MAHEHAPHGHAAGAPDLFAERSTAIVVGIITSVVGFGLCLNSAMVAVGGPMVASGLLMLLWGLVYAVPAAESAGADHGHGHGGGAHGH